MPSPLPSILNFRDAGQTVNDFTGREYVISKRLYRSASPDECTIRDRQRLLVDFGIQTIVDLRTKTEHIEQAQKRNAKIQSSELALQTNDDVASPLKIPAVTYHEINFNGWAFSKSLMSKLSWWNFGKLIAFMAMGYRKDAISIIATNVMQERGIEGLAIDSIDACGLEVKQVFSVLAEPANYPIVLHCTQGKDRTGLTIMLCLLLLGVPVDAINYDYMLTDGELVSGREERLKEIRSIGLGDDFGRCAPGMVSKVDKHIQDRYGGIQSYLTSVGVTDDMQKAVIHNLRPDNTT
ncbi:hypothetical protein EJ05DRAFT_475436 [Pseudovirgaria hyperparasitica]|uniref:Tyrosine specific protein phosphatases domain-containing protein n=1 Tax=Pseudovirgaria hyperparasitica TaxID=470096 RepID=A0A6A6W975_9PEZI|nr:uncharacterized protein EJ05DRAFT_475436 [Pseudovirgaria hyperparasitica]KAF2759213.1 hypothetical protein EJ05DRAFT_475436 [Pseudovirgaria hyperparasitica]